MSSITLFQREHTVHAAGGGTPPMSAPLITFEHADLGYGRKVVLRDVSFTVERADFLGIVGPNGAGKTTILKTLLGILPPVSGTVRLASPKPRFGYVPQRDSVDESYPLSVADMVMMARYPLMGPFARPTKRDREAVMRALEEVGIADLARLHYGSLSGGQKQRTLIARALAAEPDIMVLDEPTNGMDMAGDAAIVDLIEQLHRERNLTVIFVTHLLATVINSAHQTLFIKDGAYEVGPVSQVLTGENLSRVYGLPVMVEEIEGYKVVVRGEKAK